MSNVYNIAGKHRFKLPDCQIDRKILFVKLALHKYQQDKSTDNLISLLESAYSLGDVHEEENERLKAAWQELSKDDDSIAEENQRAAELNQSRIAELRFHNGKLLSIHNKEMKND